jgi:hypothetical protein
MIPVIGSSVMGLGALALFLATIRLGRPKAKAATQPTAQVALPPVPAAAPEVAARPSGAPAASQHSAL